MQISEVAEKFGLTTDTLRYYEREGLIGPISKGKNGILKRYLQLFDEGDKTVKERREILVEQRRILKQKLDAMQEAYDKLNYKIDLYDKNILDKNLM